MDFHSIVPSIRPLFFAEAHMDNIYAMIRKRAASAINRMRGSYNIPYVLAEKFNKLCMKY